MSSAAKEDPNAIDDGVEAEIYSCLDIARPKSFFLYAGAGSGKTRSLVNAIQKILYYSRRTLLLQGRRVAVITYTNAASDEIKKRLDFDPLVEVSTIHSFAWALIDNYNADIRDWLRVNLAKEISELETGLAKGRAGTKASSDRQRSIEGKKKR